MAKTNAMDSEIAEEFEDTALMGLKHMRAFLTYEGDNPKYLQKAKVGAVAVGAYTRLRATRANEKALLLAARKQKRIEGVVPVVPMATLAGHQGQDDEREREG